MYHAQLHGMLWGGGRRRRRRCIFLITRSILQLILSCIVCYGVEFVSADASACSPSLQQCGNLGELMYPFGKKGSPCGASPNFLLSNCTNTTSETPTTPYWDAFYGTPAVLGLDASGRVNLTWTNNTSTSTSTSMPSCHVYSRQQLPVLLPNSTFADSGVDLSVNFSAFSLSPNNIFLLFNCTDLVHASSSNYIETDSKNCKSFQNQCPDAFKTNGTCVQYQPQWELNLPKAMSRSACSHFQFLLTQNASLPVNEWKPHVVQLKWAPKDYNFHLGSLCRICNDSLGTCGFTDDGETFRCFCSNNRFSEKDCGQNSWLTTPRLLGILAGLVAVVVLAAMFTLWWLRKKRRIFTSRSAPNSNSKPWSQRACRPSSRLGPISSKEYSYQEVVEATQCFADNNIIGDGGFGSVYLGTLKDGRPVAIKRLFHDDFSRMDHFYNEIKILSRLDHPNLVQLYGFCCDDESLDLLLVFEYVSNGSVFDKLHYEDVEAKGEPPPGAGIPSWRVRLRLAMETAEALCYLHNSISPPILHRDVKTTNILLDEGFHAKLADFGLSRLVPLEVTHVTTGPQGTPGYVDPEYQSCYRLTDKSDVYSFGVVLMELVSSKLAVDMSRRDKEINLSSMALVKEKQGTWKELVDTHCWKMEEDVDVNLVVGEVVQLAFQCLRPEKADRPCMRDVVETLTKLWRTHAGQSPQNCAQCVTSL